MSSDQKNAFFAIVLSGLILFGWQYFYAPPVSPPVTETPETSSLQIEAAKPANKVSSGPIEPNADIANHSIKNNDLAVNFNSTLMISKITNSRASFGFAEIVDHEQPFQIEIAPEGQRFVVLNFQTTESSAQRWVGIDEASRITATIELNSNDFINFNLKSEKPFKYRFVFQTTPKKLENGQERNFALYDEKLHHWSIGDDELKDSNIHWAGIDFNYHLYGISFEKSKSLVARGLADGQMQLYSNNAVTDLDFDVVFVIKEYNYLTSLGRNLKNAVDFGFWGFFAELILRGLQFFYKLFPNYGIAIILLTFLVRFITFPLQYKSFVSMKKMQLIQPDLTKIREKFKDDPMRLQKESMELFKRSGANPLGGCLPLVLQLPVFFAFYKVLYSAVELVNAPFVGWLHDLSNKDPYFVLPLLMTGAMFLQQKLTPTTVTDPMQKKVFMFMPIIFGFIMKDLPSGLSLYIFTSTLLGIGQQMLVFKISGVDKKPVVV